MIGIGIDMCRLFFNTNISLVSNSKRNVLINIRNIDGEGCMLPSRVYFFFVAYVVGLLSHLNRHVFNDNILEI